MTTAKADPLKAQTDALKAQYAKDVESLQGEFVKRGQALEKRCREELEKLFRANGRKTCPRCEGTGRQERFDAGYMRRFGLRDWDGCPVCGGDGNEQEGTGHVAADGG